MTRAIVLFFLLAVLGGCEGHDPHVRLLERYSFSDAGARQRTYAGEEFPDSAGIQIYALRAGGTAKPLRVEYEVTKGGGSVNPRVVMVQDANLALTRWTGGQASTLQEMRARVYDSDGELLSSRQLRGLAFSEARWDSCIYPPERGMIDMAWSPIHDTTLLVSGQGLFIQGNRYFDWLPHPDPEFKDTRNIEVDTRGNFYIGDNDGSIHKSTDGGATWQAISKPIPGFQGVFDFTVTRNDHLWMTTYYHSIRCSRDGGTSWSVDTAGLAKDERIGDIYSLSDGTIVMMSLNSNVYQSMDDGHTWQPLDLPGKPFGLFVTPDDEIVVFALAITPGNNGYAVYKAQTPGGEYQKTAHIPSEFGARSLIHVYSHEGLYYVGIPGAGVYTTTAFEDFEIFKRLPRLFELFMSGEGLLIGTHTQHKKAYYKKIARNR